MNRHAVPRATVLARRLALPLASAIMVLAPACTDLGEDPLSAITPERFYRNEGEVLAGLAAVYASLRGGVWSYYNVSEVSSDEFIVPTRGSDWYDNGSWLELHRQTWAPASAAGLDNINGAWVDAFTGIARANVLLAALENVTVPDQETIVGEIRTLRAFYYYTLMDLFGGVPIVTNTDIIPRPQNTRAEVFDFIETELLAAREVLPDVWPTTMHGRMTQGAVDAILANMYLNAEVFTGTVTAAGLQRGDARWQDAIDAADRLLDSPNYSLLTDWRSNFTADNDFSPEAILPVRYMAQDGIGFEMIYRGLHYNQTEPDAWNGFSTIAETYNAFDVDDQRMDIFLVGQQVDVNTGEEITDRAGAPLFYTPEIANETQAKENEGVRVYKWPNDPNHSGQWHGNDYAYFRLAEMYLIRAEAMNELGGSLTEAVDLVNTLRARVFEPDEPLVAADFTQATFRDRILQERLFELTAESKRRQDLIRHDKYLLPWSFKEQREPYRILFPIPQVQMDANPMLAQNPGY
jgi:hypothetical protein